MKDGFVKVAAATVAIRVGDVEYNVVSIADELIRLEQEGVKCAVFPELCMTGYTCGDLFLQEILLADALGGLRELAALSEKWELLFVVGLPMMARGKLYNVAAVLQRGKILGLVPKSHIPNYAEFYEGRHFTAADGTLQYINIPGYSEEKGEVPFSTKLLFSCREISDFVLGVEICEDLWVPIPPSSYHAAQGATVIANLSASDEITGKDSYRKSLVTGQAARTISAYIYADAGEGESTTDLVFSGHNIISENGSLLGETKRFVNQTLTAEIDLGRLVSERRRTNTYPVAASDAAYTTLYFSWQWADTQLNRQYSKTPFVPGEQADRDHRCDEILNLQALGLKKRMEHTHCETAILGLSGGLDSTLALLVAVKAFDMLGCSHAGIHAVTMPCFGTTDRTYQNALTLAKEFGATLHEIPIHEAVELHFAQIGHDSTVQDVTYENAQARQRTLVLMDLANELGGMVIGTGDLSELALGWATYNGDHMSMYGVNASIPKTLVRYLVSYYAKTAATDDLKKALLDVLDTPVSPELLPPKDGEIAQKTEDLVGPYELHDFFLYYMMRFGYRPSKIYRMACHAFAGDFESETIKKWMHTFYKRFFAQQFKRSCLPDGPKVGSVALSPRGDWRMPSDACADSWLKEIEGLYE